MVTQRSACETHSVEMYKEAEIEAAKDHLLGYISVTNQEDIHLY